MILLRAKVETWLAKNDPGYTDVVHYDSLRPEQVVPFRRRSATVLAEPELLTRDLPQLVRHHGIDEIVVATDESREARSGTFSNVERAVSM